MQKYDTGDDSADFTGTAGKGYAADDAGRDDVDLVARGGIRLRGGEFAGPEDAREARKAALEPA